MNGEFNIEEAFSVIINFISVCFNIKLSRNLIWHLFWIIISYVGEVVIISISDTTSFVALPFRKYSSITEWHVLWTNNFTCVLISSLALKTALAWVLDKSYYLILLCLWFLKECTSPFLSLTEGEVDIETDEFFDGGILPLVEGGWDWLFHSVLSNWWSVDAYNIASMSTPSFNTLYFISDTLGIFPSLFFVESMGFGFFSSDRVWLLIKQCLPLTSKISASQSILLN